MKINILFFTLLLTSTAVLAETSKNKHKPTIIALSPHIVEMLFDVGAGEQIIGTTDFADFPEQAKKIPRIGNYIRLQLERVIELQPDLIIAWKSGNPSDDLARLAQLGFKIVYSQPNTFEDIASELRLFANLTGHAKQGEKLAEKFEQALASIKKTYQNKNELTGFYELWSRPLTTVAQGSWPQQFLNICKVKNPFKQVITPYPQISIEQVLPASVELIIQPLSVNQKDREGFNWQDWQLIPAVANKYIIQPDADAMHRMTVRSLSALKSLCVEIDSIRTKLLSTKTEL
ncbi:cobalamin-binding protein [Colwelliaceae bacterium MEBiC 14330]